MRFENVRRMGAFPIVTALLVSFAPATVRGQAGAPAIGTRVVIKPETVLRVGDRVVDTGKEPHIYRVERAHGDWLWLTTGAIGGWAKAADVIPLARAIRETVVALVRRGNAWEARGDHDRAIADYREAIRLDPRNPLAYMNRGIAWQAKGSFGKAIADYNQAIRRGLKTAQAYNNRGHAREMTKDYDRAIADYTEAIRLEPGSVRSRLNRGNAWKAKGEYGNAIADYESAIRLDPGSPWGYALQASILSASPEPEYRDGARAVKLASKASELGGSKNAYLCGIRASAHEAAGESGHAIEWRAKAREAASEAPVGEGKGEGMGVADRDRPDARRGGGPGAPIAIGRNDGPRAEDATGSPSIVDASGGLVPRPNSSAPASDALTNSFYGAYYVLPATGNSPAVLPLSGGTNIGYLSSIPTYYSGNLPASAFQYPVSPVDPAYFGANYSGKSITTPGYLSGNSSADAIGRSNYGANYSGTVTFAPANIPGSFPTNPTGTSYYGADYSGTMTFTPGSIPSGNPTGGSLAPLGTR